MNFSMSQITRSTKTKAQLRRADSSSSAKISSQQPEHETCSASVDLEDLIEDYDGPSGRSKSTSLASFLNLKQLSQSYFTASGGNRDDETTSFYSALQDGFSLNDYEQSNLSIHPNGQEWLWDSCESNERDTMLPPSNFQVFWSDLTYRIKPKITLGDLWNRSEQAFKSSLTSVYETVSCRRFKNYNPNSQECDSQSGSFYKNGPVTIIQQISGSFKSGEITAVMGPSGAGKTSLLNFLSRRREDGYTGQLYVDNSHRRVKINTIPQNDHLPEYLTVRENLTFASRLKNPHPNYEHDKYIEKISNLLGLDDCLDTRTKKISGGQHKRLSIAQELLSRPDILILDEPTSGLDSLTCYNTLNVLKNLVKQSTRKLIDPIAIVITIHQPQQEVFDIFDKVYVMANGGIAIYDGPPRKCTQFVEQYSGIRIPDNDYNPASFLIEIASGEYGDEPIKALQQQVKRDFENNKDKLQIEDPFNSSNRLINNESRNGSFRKHLKGFKQNINSKYSNDGSGDKTKEDIFVRNGARKKSQLYVDQRIAKGSSMNNGHFWYKTRTLTERCWISFIRDPKHLIALILFHIFLPIGLSLMMGTDPGRANACPNYKAKYDLNDLLKGDDDETSVDVNEELMMTLENMAVLFVMVYAVVSVNIATTCLNFTFDMQSSLKEYHNGWYSMASYLISRIVAEIPIAVCLPAITVALGYPLTGQLTGVGGSLIGYRILLTAAAFILAAMIGQTIGMIFASIYIGHVSTALFASQGACLPLVFLSGFVVRTKNMSRLVYALSNLSFFRFTMDVTIIARYAFNVCNCDPKTISGKDAELVGISERLKSFTQYWSSFADQGDNSAIDSTPVINGTQSALGTVASTTMTDEPDKDMFQLFAQQISLFNTYGMPVKSCKDMIPFHLYDLTVDESHITPALLSLVTILLSLKLLLFLTVKLVIHFRTSL